MKLKWGVSVLAVFAAAWLFATPPASAQNIKGSLAGSTTDPSGAAIPSATIRIRDVDRGAIYQLRTDANGRFQQPGLDPGNYIITAEATDFASFESPAIPLRVGETVTIQATLALPGVSTTVDVLAPTSLMRTDDVKLARSFSAEEMNDLPVAAGTQGRNFYAQARTTPGVVSTNTAHQPFSISGNRPRSTAYLVDSVDTTDANTGLIAGRAETEQIVSQEAISSFEVLTHNFKAEYGRNSGGIVSLVTKSGTNNFHGSAYWYINNSGFRARNFFEDKKPSSRSNLPGFTLGGPIRKDKAYFFAQFETYRERGQTPAQFQGLTDAERATAVASVKPLVDIYPRVPSSGSRLFTVNIPLITDLYTSLIRTDFALSQAQHLMIRVSNTQYWAKDLSVGNILGSSAPGQRQTAGATIQHNWILKPNLLNEARLGFNRQVSLDTPNSTPNYLGDPAVNGKLGSLKVTGLSTLGIPTYFNTYQFQNNVQMMDDLTWTRDAHTIKVGASVRRIQINGGDLTSAFRGALTFNSITQFLAGQPASYTIKVGNPRVGLRRTEWQSYIQDDWRLRPSLTASVGMRYEFNTAPREVYDRIPHQYLLDTDKNNIAPRIGLAWQADKKTVVRAGYGIYYNVLETSFLGLTVSNPPFISSYSATNPVFPDLGAQAATGLPSGIYVPNRKTATPYSQHMNFAVERELFGSGSTISAAYVGSQGRKLSRTRRPNGGEQLAQALRPDPTVGVVNVLETSANSSYNSLQVSLNHRVNADLTLRGSYTWASYIEDISDTTDISFNEANLRADRGYSNYDVRHTAVVTTLYRLPFWRSDRWLGGWSLSAINTVQSGRPFTLLTGTNTALGNSNNRPMDIAGSLVRNPSGSTEISFGPGFTAASVRPPGTSFGTLGRNTERGDSFLDTSVSLSKDFQWTEGLKMQVRTELYNVFNVTNFNNRDNVMTSPTFGRATAAYGPRQGQIALRFVF